MLTLASAQTILATAQATARGANMKPLAYVILDARGALKLALVEDHTSLKRAEIARAKADGAIALGMGSRAIMAMAAERPMFITGATHATGGSLVPVPGGVLIRDAARAVIGVIGISGDTSDNDELAAVAGIEAAGLVADTGA